MMSGVSREGTIQMLRDKINGYQNIIDALKIRIKELEQE